MIVGDFITIGTAKLESAQVPSARLDCLILLEDCLQRDRSWLLAHPETELNNYQRNKLGRQIKRRSTHEPLSYIRGHSEFYGRNFKVNRHVLEPRPESETMITLLKALPQPAKLNIADIGTGSGCLGITAALELPRATVDLYDIDSGALAVARHNCHLHELHLTLHKRDLISRPARAYHIVLANLPYVPDGMSLNKAATAEPRLAIFGGRDGLNHYRRLFEQLTRLTWKPSYVLTESLTIQHRQLADIAKKYNFELTKTAELIQVFEFRS